MPRPSWENDVLPLHSLGEDARPESRLGRAVRKSISGTHTMQQATHLWPETPTRSEELLECRARIEVPGAGPQTLWYRLPESRHGWVSESADSFLLGALFLAMRHGHGLKVHGTVSPSLLLKLEDFQAAWSEWLPDRYHRVEIAADREGEEKCAGDDGPACFTFSGGLDSSFTA